MQGGRLDEQASAYVRAYNLFEAVQTEAAARALAVVMEALPQARERGWRDVEFVLTAAIALHTLTHVGAQAAAEPIERLVREANRLDSRALLAVALGLRAVVAAGRGQVADLLQDAARAVALLDDSSQRATDRCTGYVVAAAAFNALQLWELVDELYERASSLEPFCEAPVQASAVAVNRVLIRIEWATALLENGDEASAHTKLREAEEAAPVALRQKLSALWRVDVQACACIAVLLRHPADDDARAAAAGYRAALVAGGDLEVRPLLDAAVAYSLWRAGRQQEAACAAAALAPSNSASCGSRSFPLWVRARVLALSGDGEAQQSYASAVNRARWQFRSAMLAAAGDRIDVERRRHEHDQLTVAVNTDPLTGLGNRRAFDAWLRTANCVLPTALLLIDVNEFKSINDRYGHELGDLVLQRLGRLITHAIRPGDDSIRQGGDEFAVILTGAEMTVEMALERAEQVRRKVETECWNLLAAGLQVTVSVGVSYDPSPGPSGPVDLYRAADRALYQAKAT